MLTKCANPACETPFRYLRDGRVFRAKRAVEDGVRPGHNMEHFWLCGRCSRTLMLHSSPQGEITVVPQRPGWERRIACKQQLSIVPGEGKPSLLTDF